MRLIDSSKEYSCKICGCIAETEDGVTYPVGEDRMCRWCKKAMYDVVDYDFSINPRNPYSPIGLAVAKVIAKKFPWLAYGENDDLFEVTDYVLNFAWCDESATPNIDRLVENRLAWRI